MLTKIIVYYTIKMFKKLNWLWFEIIINFKDETLNLQRIKTLSKIHIYSKNDEKRNISCIWTIISIYYNKLQKTLFQNSFIWKKKFGEKDIQSFSKVIMQVRCTLFAPLAHSWDCQSLCHVEPFKGHELSKNKVQWLDLESWLWLPLKGSPCAKTVYAHFVVIMQFSWSLFSCQHSFYF